MAITVMKFGGTSMDNLTQVASLVESQTKSSSVIAVVSAFSGITDQLLALAKEIPQGHKKEKYFLKLLQPILDANLKKIELVVSAQHKESFLSELEIKMESAIKNLAVDIQGLQNLLAAGRLDEQTFSMWVEDAICGFGEFLSSLILSKFLSSFSHVSSKHVDLSRMVSRDSPRKKGYLHSKEFLYGDLIHDIRKNIRNVILEGKVPVLGGYIGRIPGGILQTIDRGYTDSTAALVAVAASSVQDIKDTRLQIWKEVPGLMSADPRLVEPGYNGKTHTQAKHFQVAKLRSKVSFAEAAELSVLGGMKAINPNGIHVLDGRDIILEVRNTFEPKHPGTIVTKEDDKEVTGIRFISAKKNQVIYRVKSNKMVNQSGVAGEIFRLCAELKIDVDAITTSATTVAFSVDGKSHNRDQLEKDLAKIGNIKVYPDMALVCCIGNNLAKSVGLLSKLSGILAKNSINIEFDGGDADTNVTFIVEGKNCDKAIKVLHSELFS